MKNLILVVAVIILASCNFSTKKAKAISAQVVSIEQYHDSYADGGFAYFTIVRYRILNSEKTIKRYFESGAPELKSIAVGQIVTLKNEND